MCVCKLIKELFDVICFKRNKNLHCKLTIEESCADVVDESEILTDENESLTDENKDSTDKTKYLAAEKKNNREEKK